MPLAVNAAESIVSGHAGRSRAAPELALGRALGLTIASWHLASLDAPLVVTVWLAFAFHSTGHTAPPALLLAMFSAAWAVYATDRLLDADGTTEPSQLAARHRFHARHRGQLHWLVPAAVLVSALALLRSPHASVAALLLTTVAFALWFAAVHLPARRGALPKEIVVGLFFSVAAFGAAWAAQGSTLPSRWPPPQTLLLTAALALLGILNATLITAWEDGLDHAHRSTGWLAEHARPLLAWLLLSPIVTADAALLPIALAAGALLLLHAARGSLHPLTQRSLADVPLLLPALWLLPAARTAVALRHAPSSVHAALLLHLR